MDGKIRLSDGEWTLMRELWKGPASVGAALWAAAQGACAVRVHDVAETVQALRAFRRAKEAADV